MIRAVIFDMDGVIVDSEPAHIEAEKRIMMQHGIKATTEDLRSYTGTTAEFEFTDLISKHHLRTTPEKLIREKDVILFELLEKETQPTKGVITLIKDLKQHGFKLGIASSGRGKLVFYFLKKLKIEHLFDTVVCAEDITHSKPHPEIFMKAAERLREEPENCIVIEDSKLGVEAAKRAGMKCIGFRNPNSGNQDLSKADLIVDDFTKLEIQRLKSL